MVSKKVTASRKRPKAARSHKRPSPEKQISDDLLLAPVTWDNPLFRRHIENNPPVRQRLVKKLRDDHNNLTAYMEAQFDDFAADCNREWNQLPAKEREFQFKNSAEEARRHEERLELFGSDWSLARSTDRVPAATVAPVFDYIRKNKDVISKHIDISADDVADVVRGLSIPVGVFLKVIEFMESNDPLARALKIGDNQIVNSVSALTEEIIAAWNAKTPTPLPGKTPAQLQNMAAIAAKTALSFLQNHHIQTVPEGHVVDPVSGLTIPPNPGNPYQERGRDEKGERPDAFEHIRKNYSPYIDAGLLFSGHLLEIDKPVYEAALYLARKEVKARADQGERITSADVFMRNGILVGEHLDHPPEHLKRQIGLINRARALAMAPKARGRRFSPDQGNGRQ